MIQFETAFDIDTDMFTNIDKSDFKPSEITRTNKKSQQKPVMKKSITKKDVISSVSEPTFPQCNVTDNDFALELQKLEYDV